MKKALIASMALHVITIAAFAFKRLYFNHRPVVSSPSEWSINWNKVKQDLFSSVPIDSGDIVFIGDSHIERFILNDFYPNKKVRNRGIGSNTTDQVINRLSDILLRKPSKLFLLIGINDLAMRRPIDSIFNNIVTIAGMAKSSGATLYVISLFPSTGADAYLNDETVTLNAKLSQYCKREGETYIDIYPLLVNHRQLNKELTSDGTHLNSKGYLIFKKEVDRYIN